MPRWVKIVLLVIAAAGFFTWLGWERLVGSPSWLNAIGFLPWLRRLEPLDKWVGILAAVLVGSYAIFHETLWAWLRRPVLEVECEPRPPHITMMPIQPPERPDMVSVRKNSAGSLQIRIKVSNHGKRRAENVEVYARGLARKEGVEYVDQGWFLPMNLRWAHQESEDLAAMIYTGLSPKIERMCNLAQMIEPRFMPADLGAPQAPAEFKYQQTGLLQLHTVVTPTNLSNFVFPGEYKLDLTVAAANARSLPSSLYLKFDGTWTQDLQTMLSQGLSFRLAPGDDSGGGILARRKSPFRN